jgi:hypothetical protein
MEHQAGTSANCAAFTTGFHCRARGLPTAGGRCPPHKDSYTPDPLRVQQLF